MKNLLRALPAVAAASAAPGRACSTCMTSRSLTTRPLSLGATSGWLWGLRTKVGAASSDSSSSSTIRISQRHLGARVSDVDPWPIMGPAPAGTASTADGSAAIGLLPATLSSVVGARQFPSSSLLVYWSIRSAMTAGGSTPVGGSISGASDTYTVARSTSPIYNKSMTSLQHKNVTLLEHCERTTITLGAGRPSL